MQIQKIATRNRIFVFIDASYEPSNKNGGRRLELWKFGALKSRFLNEKNFLNSVWLFSILSRRFAFYKQYWSLWYDIYVLTCCVGYWTKNFSHPRQTHNISESCFVSESYFPPRLLRVVFHHSGSDALDQRSNGLHNGLHVKSKCLGWRWEASWGHSSFSLFFKFNKYFLTQVSRNGN